MNRDSIWAFVPSDDEWRDAAARLKHSDGVRRLARLDEVPGLLSASRMPHGCIWVTPSRHDDHLCRAIQSVNAASQSVRHIFRVMAAPRVSSVLFSLLRCSPNALVTLHECRLLVDDVNSLTRDEPLPRTEAQILSSLSINLNRKVAEFAADVAVVAVLLGRRPTSVEELARTLRISVKQLRERMHDLCGLDPGALLRWVFVLHCIADADKFDRPLKVIAAEAGYKNAESLTNRMARICGVRLRGAIRKGGYEALAGEFADLLLVGATVAANRNAERSAGLRAPSQLKVGGEFGLDGSQLR